MLESFENAKKQVSSSKDFVGRVYVSLSHVSIVMSESERNAITVKTKPKGVALDMKEERIILSRNMMKTFFSTILTKITTMVTQVLSKVEKNDEKRA